MAQQGPAAMKVLVAKQGNDPKFRFLHEADQFHSAFMGRVRHFEAAAGASPGTASGVSDNGKYLVRSEYM